MLQKETRKLIAFGLSALAASILSSCDFTALSRDAAPQGPIIVRMRQTFLDQFGYLPDPEKYPFYEKFLINTFGPNNGMNDRIRGYFIAAEIYEESNPWILQIGNVSFFFTHEINFLMYVSPLDLFISPENASQAGLLSIPDAIYAFKKMDQFEMHEMNFCKTY